MAEYDAKGLQDKDNNKLNFTPTHFMDAQGNSKSIEVELGKKQNTLSVEADSADIDDSTPIVKTLDGAKLKTALAVKFWNYIKGKISSVLGLTVTNYGGTANTATNYNTSSGTIKTELEGKSSTTHTHSVSINGSTKTIAASGGTAVDLGTYKVFNYAKVFTSQEYNANTNRYIMLAFNAATYTNNWEESSMFKLEVHDGLLPKELVFRLWLKGGFSGDVIPDDPDPKLYRVYSENFSESALNILDVRLFVVEKSAVSIQFTIGIFIDRNYLQEKYASYQLYPLSYGTRDRGNTINNGLSNWTYTVGKDNYSENIVHDNVFTTKFAVNDLTVDMTVTKAINASIDITGDTRNLDDIVLQDLLTTSKEYTRWICKSSAGSANISGRPVNGLEPFALEGYVTKRTATSPQDGSCKIFYYPEGRSAPWFSEVTWSINGTTTFSEWKHLGLDEDIATISTVGAPVNNPTAKASILLPPTILCSLDPSGPATGRMIAITQFMTNKLHQFLLYYPRGSNVAIYNNLLTNVTVVYPSDGEQPVVELLLTTGSSFSLNSSGNFARRKPCCRWASLIEDYLYIMDGY